MKKKIVVLTGAGVSQESGIKTFRDSDGLWENHDISEVATPQGWNKNKALVLKFYNERRAALKTVEPNDAHHALVDLEEQYDVVIVTQNVDDLHERAGSRNIIHLHGQLLKVRSTGDESLIYDCKDDVNIGDVCDKGHQLRPHIVWFGEEVPMLERGANEVRSADIIIIIGTSMQVYPAAGLVGLASPGAQIYYIDPYPSINFELSVLDNLEVIKSVATIGMRELAKKLLV